MSNQLRDWYTPDSQYEYPKKSFDFYKKGLFVLQYVNNLNKYYEL